VSYQTTLLFLDDMKCVGVLFLLFLGTIHSLIKYKLAVTVNSKKKEVDVSELEVGEGGYGWLSFKYGDM
jgi:hypothetical protein